MIQWNVRVLPRRTHLLDEPGWKRFRRLAKREGLVERLVQQAKLRSFQTSPKFKLGYKIPRNYDHAMEFDAAAANGLWHINLKWIRFESMKYLLIKEYTTCQRYHAVFNKYELTFATIINTMVAIMPDSSAM